MLSHVFLKILQNSQALSIFNIVVFLTRFDETVLELEVQSLENAKVCWGNWQTECRNKVEHDLENELVRKQSVSLKLEQSKLIAESVGHLVVVRREVLRSEKSGREHRSTIDPDRVVKIERWYFGFSLPMDNANRIF